MLSSEQLKELEDRFIYPSESWAELGEAAQAEIPALISEIRELKKLVPPVVTESAEDRVARLSKIGTLDPAATTLEEAIVWTRSRISKGIDCPCCDQLAKIYKRSLNSGMATCLIALRNIERKIGEGSWIYTPDWAQAYPVLAKSREYPKLVYWGLVEGRELDRSEVSTTKCSGQWRLTPAGRRFAQGETQAKRHVFVYDGWMLRFGEDMITIQEALDDAFNYAELMEGES